MDCQEEEEKLYIFGALFITGAVIFVYSLRNLYGRSSNFVRFPHLKRHVVLLLVGAILMISGASTLTGFNQLYPNPLPVFFIFLPVAVLYM